MAFSVIEEEFLTTLKALIGSFMAIPIYSEVGVPKEQGVPRKRSRVQFTFKNWNTDYPTQFFLNNRQSELKEGDDFTVSAVDGYIDLITTAGSTSQFKSDGAYAGELPVGSQIEGQYKFKFFNDDDLLQFLELGLNAVNMRRPATGFPNLDSAPGEFTEAIIMYAYMRCLEKILFDTLIWNNRLLFSNQESPFDATYLMSILQSRLTAASTAFDNSAWFAKPRSFTQFRGVTSGRLSTRQRVTAANFTSFILGGSL